VAAAKVAAAKVAAAKVAAAGAGAVEAGAVKVRPASVFAHRVEKQSPTSGAFRASTRSVRSAVHR